MTPPIKLGLFVDPTARPKWTGGKALVPVPRDSCPECRGPLSERSFGQLPLFAHGGYGAVRTHVTVWCHCGWTVVRSITETNPKERVA